MVNKRILTVEDLVKFFSTQNFTKFSSKETGYKLSVQVPATFEIDETVDESHRGMMRLKFRIFHTGLNRNGSYVSDEAASKAMPTIKNRPIMAYIHQLDNGEWDFEAHNMRIVTNEDGDEEIVYDESQIGSFSEEEPFFEYDKDLDKTYVCAYGYIPEEYSKACDILRAKNGSKNSCELCIEELSYNAKEHYLDLQEFYVMASTLLGRKKDGTLIEEGMLGSRADIANFNKEENGQLLNENNKLIETLEKLNETLSNLNINNHLKEGGTDPVNKFEELLNKYNKTVDDIVFEYEGLSDEELELKFAEVFEENNTDGEGNDSEPTSEDGGEENDIEGEAFEEETDAKENSEEETSEGVTECESEENTNEDDNNEEVVNDNYSHTEEKFIKKFEISHEDVRYALYNLLSPFESADNEWYFICAVYDTYFVYENWNGDKIFGQSYSKDGDNVAFDGERYNLHRELLTDQEYAELQSMRSTYEALVQFKSETENAKLRAEKESILYDSKYSVLAEKDENNEYKNSSFAKLVSDMDNYSLADLEKELKSVFADHITSGGQFSYIDEANTKPVVNKKYFANTDGKDKKSSRYGNLFKK